MATFKSRREQNFYLQILICCCLFTWSSNIHVLGQLYPGNVTTFSFSLAADGTNDSISIAGVGVLDFGNAQPNATTVLLNSNLERSTSVRALLNNPFSLEGVNGTPYSFSTNFTFSIVVNASMIRGDGFTFTIGSTTPNDTITNDTRGNHLGLFHKTDFGGSPNVKAFAVEFDCYKNPELLDLNGNHIGVDINDIVSTTSADLGSRNIILGNGGTFTCSIDYDAIHGVLDVYLVNGLTAQRDSASMVISTGLNLASDLDVTANSTNYVGFSLGTGGGTLGVSILSWDIVAWPIQSDS